MIRLDELRGWKLIPQGKTLNLPADLEDLRLVRVHVNCEDQTWVYAAHADLPKGLEAQFIGSVGPGVETITFHVAGDVSLSFAPAVKEDQPSQVWVQTSEIEPNVSDWPEAVSFTEIMTRRARNSELEMMQAIARHNQRQMEAVLAEQAGQIAELRELATAKEKVNEPAPAPVTVPAREVPGKDNPPASPKGEHGFSKQPTSGDGSDDDGSGDGGEE